MAWYGGKERNEPIKLCHSDSFLIFEIVNGVFWASS